VGRARSHRRPPHLTPWHADAAWVAARVRQAWELRAPLRACSTDAYRWVYGEGDGLPAIVVDLYGAYAAVRRYAAGTAALLPWLIKALHEIAPLKGIIERGADDDRRLHLLWVRSRRVTWWSRNTG